MRYPKDITGITFGTLTAIEETGEIYGDSKMWLCKCSCGREGCPVYVIRPRRNLTRKDWKPTCGIRMNHSNRHSEYYRFRNETVQKNNTVGIAGVTKEGSSYIVRTMENGKRTIKRCSTLLEAERERKIMEQRKWGVINAKRSSQIPT